MPRLNFPIGSSDFEKIRINQAEYVDKSLLIAELLRDEAEVFLFPRPRRFGKTLNLSMLKYFFDIRRDSKALFQGLQIATLPEFQHINRYPVIYLTLKDVKERSFANTLGKLGMVMAELYREHHYLLDSPALSSHEKVFFSAILADQASQKQLEESLRALSQWLFAHYQAQVVILMDEYDSPIHAAHTESFYQDLIGFMRSFMGATFKDNSTLFKGIITGILRVSKEGMFSGLNNIRVHGILSNSYAQHYGFTQQEIDALLSKANRPELREQVRLWYNGFQFGALDIYNPWSIINFFADDFEFKPYWVGTSDNALVKQIVAQGSAGLKSDFETLVSGGEIVRDIDEFITLPELFAREDIAFSLLLFSGYLKVTHKTITDTTYRCTLRIPNLEIKALFHGFLKTFFDPQHFTTSKYQSLTHALVSGDTKLSEKLLSEYLLECFSYFDVKQKEPEKFYHGFVLGLLVSLQETHWVQSNRESGYGRYDVMIIPKDSTKLGTVIEFKVVDQPVEIAEGITEAFQQIDDRAYATELQTHGITRIQTLAIVFCGKQLKLAVR